MTPDVNVLVAASRQDHPHHAIAYAWLLGALNKPSSNLCLLNTVIASFLRLVTHPKIFTIPTPTEDAVHFVDALLGTAGVKLLAVQDEWHILRGLCLQQQLKGNALPDAWIAACVLKQQEVLVTFDRDFLRLLPPKHLQLLKP